MHGAVVARTRCSWTARSRGCQSSTPRTRRYRVDQRPGWSTPARRTSARMRHRRGSSRHRFGTRRAVSRTPPTDHGQPSSAGSDWRQREPGRAAVHQGRNPRGPERDEQDPRDHDGDDPHDDDGRVAQPHQHRHDGDRDRAKQDRHGPRYPVRHQGGKTTGWRVRARTFRYNGLRHGWLRRRSVGGVRVLQAVRAVPSLVRKVALRRVPRMIVGLFRCAARATGWRPCARPGAVTHNATVTRKTAPPRHRSGGEQAVQHHK